MDLAFAWSTLLALVHGIPLTLLLALLSTLFGLVLAVSLAVSRIWAPAWLAMIARGYVFVFRGTPLLVQIFLIYYGLGQFEVVRDSILWPILREPFWCAVIALAMNTGAYGSEIVRGGLLSVPHGQIEAARACGMSAFLAFRRIIMPIAVRQALPGYGNELILMVKATALASIIALMEITGIAAKLISESYRVVEVFVVAGAIYLAINFTLTRIVAFAEYRLSGPLRERPGLLTPAPAAEGDRA
jgi:octopine/nopaline transport system permease protein